MFKKLKDKIAEEVKQSPSKISATVSQLAQAVVSPSSSSIVEPTAISDLNFSISEDVEEHSSPAKRGFTSVDLREESSVYPVNMMRSRHSSTSSLVSDNASFFPHYEPHGSSFNLQSDLESASEMDDSFSSQVTSTSKEHLVGLLRKSQQRYNKYKGRYADLAKHYRELERDNYKAKAILSESQDKALRRIAELKEQCQLEQRAKAHLEEILRNDLEEKDHLIMTLNTKIDLLKLNDSPDTTLDTSLISTALTESSLQTSNEIQNMFSQTLIEVSDVATENDLNQNEAGNEPVDTVRDKVKKLEVLLAKCKDAIKIHKEKVKEYSVQNDNLKAELALMQETASGHLKHFEAAQEEILFLKKREEESALSLAETKRSIHSEMEMKEEQIKHLRQSILDINAQKDEFGVKCNRLEGQVSEMKQSQELEKTSDNEKQIQELSRVKQEAMKILQAKFNNTLLELKNSSATKISELEKQIKELIESNELLQSNNASSQELLEKQIKELIESNELLQSNNASSQELLEKQIKELIESNELLQRNNTSSQELLEKQIKELIESNELLQRNNTSSQELLEKQIKELIESNELLQSNNASSQELLEKQIKQLTESNELLQNKSSSTQELLEKKIQELTSSNEVLLNNNSLSQELLENKIKELTKSNEVLENFKASSQERLDEFVASAFVLQSQIKQLETENNSLQARVRISEVQATLNDDLSESKYAENIETMEMVIANLQESHSQLQTQYSTLHKTLIEKQNQADNFLTVTNKLEDDNCALREINRNLDIRVQELTAALSSANITVSKIKIQRHKIQQEHELVIKANEAEINALSEKLIAMAEKLASKEKESEELQRTVATDEDNLVTLRAQLESSREESVTNQITINKISAKKVELERELRDLQEANLLISNKNEHLIKEQEELVKSLQLKVESTEAELSNTTSKLARLTEELSVQINICNLNNETLASQLSEKQAEFNKLKEDFSEQAKLYNACIENLTEKEAEFSNVKDELISQVNSLTMNNDNLASQLAEKQSEINSQVNSLSTNDEKFASVLSQKQAEVDRVTLELSHIQEMRSKSTSEKDKLLATLHENSEELDKKSIELIELRDKLAALDEAPKQLAVVTEQLLEAKTNNNKLVEDLQSCTLRHDELCAMLTNVKSELKTAISEKKQLETDLKFQAAQDSNLSEVVKQFQDEKQQSCSQFEELQVKLESQEHEIEQLAQSLSESKSALKQRDVELEENEELQRQKIKILARNFDEKLHLREEELSKMFDEERAKLESTEGLAVNQLRTHIKALKSEVRQAEDTIGNLNKLNKDLVKQKELEIIALEEKIKDVSLANEFEIRECEQKWRSSLEKELSEREIKHKEEVDALSREWNVERKANNTEIPAPTQELESTSKVAVAAVESGTGSIDLMHRQLLAITRELNDAKRRHKMETVELRRIIENRSKGGETTELEYLRNILFEYMMGREPTVLARVIAAVLKFDQDQTNKIIEKEEHKQSLVW